MILIAAGLLAGILIALDAQRNLRTGTATTLFRAFTRLEHATAFWTIFGIKLLLSAALAILCSALIIREST